MTIQNKLFIMLACLSVFCTQIFYSVEVVAQTAPTELQIKTEAETCYDCDKEQQNKTENLASIKDQEVCKSVMKSLDCSSERPEDLMDCSKDNNKLSYQAAFLGCFLGFVDLWGDALRFYWDILKFAFNKFFDSVDPETEAQSKSMLLYISNEYDKAYDQSYSSTAAFSSVGINILEILMNQVESKMKNADCLNTEAYNNRVCYGLHSLLAVTNLSNVNFLIPKYKKTGAMLILSEGELKRIEELRQDQVARLIEKHKKDKKQKTVKINKRATTLKKQRPYESGRVYKPATTTKKQKADQRATTLKKQKADQRDATTKKRLLEQAL